MNEEEFEDWLGFKYGWPKPIGMPKRPIIFHLICWLGMLAWLGWFIWWLIR